MNYQEKVSTKADVRALYEKVIKQPNIARYRGYTSQNSYGWNSEAEDYIKKIGEAWFDNPAYSDELEIGYEKVCDTINLLKEQFDCLFNIIRDNHSQLLQKDEIIRLLKSKIAEEGDDFE